MNKKRNLYFIMEKGKLYSFSYLCEMFSFIKTKEDLEKYGDIFEVTDNIFVRL